MVYISVRMQWLSCWQLVNYFRPKSDRKKVRKKSEYVQIRKEVNQVIEQKKDKPANSWREKKPQTFL